MSEARIVGNYELTGLLGRGGMGEVWYARHRSLERPAAVKLIRPDSLIAPGQGSELLVKRFEREAKVTAGLRSPHSVELYDFGRTSQGEFWYAMELLDGINLRTLVEDFGPLPPARVAYLLAQACEALAEAHGQGVVHRDIKPANLFACRMGGKFDLLKVLDFGLVKHLDDARQTQLTADGLTAGSPAFMAPEIAYGTAVDARADIYALGCVAYWLLTGTLVFTGKTALQVVMAHASEIPQRASVRLGAAIPAALEDVVAACLSKSPADRPADANKLQHALLAAVTSEDWDVSCARQWWQALDAKGVSTPGAAGLSAAKPLPATTVVKGPVTGSLATESEPAQSVGDVSPHRRPTPLGESIDVMRSQTFVKLQDALGDDVLTMTQFDERMSLAGNARSPSELRVLTADFPKVEVAKPAGLPVIVAPEEHLPAVEALISTHRRRRTRFLAIFGAAIRRGIWRPPGKVRAIAVFGGVEVDFREAELLPGETVVTCVSVFGGVEIVAPPEVRVVVEGIGIFGGFDPPRRSADTAEPEAPISTIRVKGVSVFGGVSVNVRHLESRSRGDRRRIGRGKRPKSQAHKRLPKPEDDRS